MESNTQPEPVRSHISVRSLVSLEATDFGSSSALTHNVTAEGLPPPTDPANLATRPASI